MHRIAASMLLAAFIPIAYAEAGENVFMFELWARVAARALDRLRI